MPTVTVFADRLQEQLVLLKRPPPLPERGIEGMDPALAAGLIRSALDEFGNFDPVDLFAGSCNGGLDEGGQKAEGEDGDGLYVLTALMRTSSSRAVHLRSRNGYEPCGRGVCDKARAGRPGPFGFLCTGGLALATMT